MSQTEVSRLPKAESCQNGVIDLGDLTPIEVHYRIGGKEYILREASEATVAVWNRHWLNSREYDSEGKFVALKPQASDLDALLLSMCLFQASADKTESRSGQPAVPLTQIQQWPSRVTGPLVKKCKEISDLDKAENPETLRKEIEVLQRRLAKMEGEGSAKNVLDGGVGNSGSATS